jgi:hypothetical protein
MPLETTDMSEVRQATDAIINEAERLATDTFRRYIGQMSEVIRYDFGTEGEADMCLHTLTALRNNGEVTLRSGTLIRWTTWLGTLGTRKAQAT